MRTTKKRVFTFFPIILFIIFFLASCASSPTPREEIISPEKTGAEIETSEQVEAMNQRILMSSLSSKGNPYHDYKIGPEDLLDISVFEVEKLNKTVRVSSQGNISLPLLGVLRVKGLTANQLEKELTELLAEKYLRDPQVSVFIKEYHSQRISVMGAVQNPDVFETTGRRTILDMLAMAEGLRADAGNMLFLIRPPRLEGETPRTGPDSAEASPRTFVITSTNCWSRAI